MDPVSLIVMALASGAAAGLKPAAEQAVKDAYAAVKSLIQRKYAGIDLGQLERRPDSEAKRSSVAEDLKDAGAAQDQELLDGAKTLMDAVEQHDPAAAAAIGINLTDVKAQFLRAQQVVAEGAGARGVQIERGEFSGGI